MLSRNLSGEQQLRALNIIAPIDLMRFTLTFDGDLPASGNKPKPKAVWALRRAFHPQIEDLLNTHPVMSELVPDERYFSQHNVRGFNFIPVVRRRHSMICSLDITFLRRMEGEGLVHQGGDLDNRIKTLFDGLRMPDKGDEIPEAEVQYDPFYALLETDAQINRISVKPDKLLNVSDRSAHWVKLIIEVHVSVTRVTLANASFLGD